ncbi:MAG TPA: hypothetical protein VMF66_00265 [Candidatus Acidoferrum sp.]|nr:hypothetical protein [Candidatus Acidoferrum sp.]
MRGTARAKRKPKADIKVDKKYHCHPQDATVDDKGQVTFHVNPNGCDVLTDPPDAFQSESNGRLALKKGNTTFAVNVQDTTIHYCACAPGGTCDPNKRIKSGGNTIKVGSAPISRSK